MNKILCFSFVTSAILLQNISVATASEQEVSSNDFTRIVCSHLEKIDSKSNAVKKIKAITKSNASDAQLATLEEIAKSDTFAQDFCSDFSLPRM